MHFSYHWGLVGFILIAIPVSQILARAGYSRWWTLLLLIPVINLISLWLFAFADWPKDRKDSNLKLQ